ncbi:hypothetical protein [Pyrobaculum ferrireducens]|uniref:Uncharacterized protein n=1 Tax=Pyrobaculum ferrireducens TaxID=1104324 RepID=G7VAJ5_9CREN|nr:hypothetical protein [Pyrobaculum ferrireducens]AET32234.1 hypothetical protein P186_0788 [Pyrobaculum ferrireducens]
MWLKIGKSEPRAFFYAVVWVIRASQAALALSAALFLSGIAAAWGRDVGLHLWFMTSGLVSFYFSVMYLQLPGFINAAPVKPATAAAFATLAAALLRLGPYPLLPLAVLYLALHLKALRGSPNFYPNWIMVAGLATAATAATPFEAAASFPLGSVLTLFYRIDSSRLKRRFSAGGAAAVAAAHLAGFALVKTGHLWGVALPIAAVSLAAPPVPRDVYGVGVALGRVLMALGWLHHHFLYMGFAVVMAVLCVPYFVPGVLYRRAPRFGWENLALAASAAAARLAGFIEAAAVLVAVLIAYVAVRMLREEAVPLKPP